MAEQEGKERRGHDEEEDGLVCEPYELRGYFSASWDDDTYYCHEGSESGGRGSTVRRPQHDQLPGGDEGSTENAK